MKSKIRLLYFLVLNLVYISIMVWTVHSVVTRKVSVLWIFLFIAMLMRLPEMITAYSRYSPKDDGYSIDLSIKPVITGGVTPDLISQILGNENVIQVIRNDLSKTGQIGYKEEWRLGLITPDQDILGRHLEQYSQQKRRALENADSRQNLFRQTSVKRAAVLHSTDYFKSNNIAIADGAIRPLGSPKWSYSLSTKLNRGEFIGIRNIQVENNNPRLVGQRSPSLPEFLIEDGFPLKESYVDGDPLTTERGGTIVIDKDKVIVIYPHYFVQRRLIDDEGNLVYLGIDENFDNSIMFKVKTQPSLSRLLIKRVSSKGYTPVVRYRSFPFASDFMLALLDTPMSASGWADLFIDTRGRAKLFIAKDKTEAEWYEMMNRLKQLFYNELARKDFHLLGLTKDRIHLHQYLSKKQDILGDYYIIQERKLF
jgi:hypothetical protein